jgi:inorganic triphosphatase YgiF
LAVEVKSSIPDERTSQRLLKAGALAVFSLEEPRVAELHDRYLDTPDSAFRAGGHACRFRWQDCQNLATLKGLGAVPGAIHHRTEHQVDLPETLSPRDWPQSAARDLALHPGSGEPLFLLFETHQTRHLPTPPLASAQALG